MFSSVFMSFFVVCYALCGNKDVCIKSCLWEVSVRSTVLNDAIAIHWYCPSLPHSTVYIHCVCQELIAVVFTVYFRLASTNASLIFLIFDTPTGTMTSLYWSADANEPGTWVNLTVFVSCWIMSCIEWSISGSIPAISILKSYCNRWWFQPF